MTCGRGGTGRRAGFRIQWGDSWRFESSRPHQVMTGATMAPSEVPRRTVEYIGRTARGQQGQAYRRRARRRSRSADRRGIRARHQEGQDPGLSSGQGPKAHDRQSCWQGGCRRRRAGRGSDRQLRQALDAEELRPIAQPEMARSSLWFPARTSSTRQRSRSGPR